jgi:predicted ATP-grasp superfamily ATP-dependent carboligase
VILLVAVSARMLAELARHEGHEVVALDRFGDLDLQALCPSVSILRDLGGRGGMAGLVDAADDIPAAGVVYGAGLENRPDLVARLVAGRTLLGCAPQTLRRVRDPAVLGASLRAAGFAYPRTLPAREAPMRADDDRRWLRKPVRGGGGRGVRTWRGGRLRSSEIVQHRISGLPCSAAAVADGRFAALLGVSEQLTGLGALGARGYTWCGNLSPPRLPEAERRALTGALRAICEHLAAAFGLRGLFGVDVVWDGVRPWVIEVNPRPTASLETIATVHSVRPFTAHLEACAGRLPPAATARSVAAAAGKAVVYATEDLRTPDTREWAARGIRDVPHAGEPIARGHPICTLVATGRSPEAVLAGLERRAAALRAELHDCVVVDAVA